MSGTCSSEWSEASGLPGVLMVALPMFFFKILIVPPHTKLLYVMKIFFMVNLKA